MTWNSNDGFVGFTNSIPHEAIDNANYQIPRFVSGTISFRPIYVPKTLHTKLDGFSIGFLQNKSHLTNNDHNFLNINHNYAYFHIIGTWWPPGLFFLFVNQMEHLMATRCVIFFLLYSSCTWWPLGPIFWITDKMATWWPPNQFFLHYQLKGPLVATKCSFFLSSTRMAPNGDQVFFFFVDKSGTWQPPCVFSFFLHGLKRHLMATKSFFFIILDENGTQQTLGSLFFFLLTRKTLSGHQVPFFFTIDWKSTQWPLGVFFSYC